MEDTLKRRDMGLTGAVIILAQVLTSFQSSHGLSNKIQELQNSVHQLKVDQKSFAKKEEVRSILKRLDQVNIKLTKITNKIQKANSFVSFQGGESCSQPKRLLSYRTF